MNLYSYKNVWKVETKIYAIQNLKLPVPVNPVELGYFLAVAAIVFFFDKTVPILSFLPSLIKYVALPFGLTVFLRKKKLDGKAPQRFLCDYIVFLFTRNKKREFFRTHEKEEANIIKLNWSCSGRIY